MNILKFSIPVDQYFITFKIDAVQRSQETLCLNTLSS